MAGDKKSSSYRPFVGAVRIFRTSDHAVVSLFLFFLLFSFAGAQSAAPNGQQYYARFSPSMAIIIVVLVAALFFMGFFSVYIRHCSNTAGGNNIRPVLSLRSRRAAAARGLEPAVIETFPTFPYSEVKGLKIGKGALECAVCLNEFDEEETLRLIPKCDHVFHPECIDEWLASHVTCPVCRANLVPQPGESAQSAPDESGTELERENHAAEQTDGDVSIRIRDENETEPEPEPAEVVNRPPRSWSVRQTLFGKFRSHSTGHSLVTLVVPGQNLDRFTLRLPEQVRKDVVNRALSRRSGSFSAVLPRQASSRRGYRTGEGSSRGKSNRRVDKLDREVKSDRFVFSITPPFFLRASSMKSPKVVADNSEASTSAV